MKEFLLFIWDLEPFWNIHQSHTATTVSLLTAAACLSLAYIIVTSGEDSGTWLMVAVLIAVLGVRLPNLAIMAMILLALLLACAGLAWVWHRFFEVKQHRAFADKLRQSIEDLTQQHDKQLADVRRYEEGRNEYLQTQLQGWVQWYSDLPPDVKSQAQLPPRQTPSL